MRAAVEDRLGNPIVSAVSQSAGFSPGVAARLRTEDGRHRARWPGTGWHTGQACGKGRSCREETNESVRGAKGRTWTTRGSAYNYPNRKHRLDSYEGG